MPVGNCPYGVAINPDGTKVYVTHQLSNTTSVIDTATRIVVATVTVGSGPCGIAISSDGKKVFVVNKQNNAVSGIDISTKKAKKE